jgi:hypothetical protein
MRIVRVTPLCLVVLGVGAWLSAPLMATGQMPDKAASHPMPMVSKGMMTKDQKIGNAMSAAPASVSAQATILDWPAKEGDPPVVLRPGSNGWSCLPDMPDTQGNDPMCLDQAWMKWVEAYLTHKPPQVTTTGPCRGRARPTHRPQGQRRPA